MRDPVLSPDALRALPDVRLFDCRQGPQARAAYAAGHLPGALYVDLERDLAAPTPHPERGGRHPLPSPAAFAATLGRWGITPASVVVAYDDQGGANAAARLWWTLRAFGHPSVQVLDGGIQAAVQAGMELTSEVPAGAPVGPYPASNYQSPTVDIDAVDRLRERNDHRVLDVRAAPRFRGEHEPIDPVAGHIPGAHNLPFAQNLDATGRFKSSEALAAQYRAWLGEIPSERLIVHCGSGVTACHTLLALERAGLHGAKLYTGSWSEWCRNPERPRAGG